MSAKRKKQYQICLKCGNKLRAYSEPFFPQVEGRLHHNSTVNASIGESWFRRYFCVTCNLVKCYRVQKTASRPYPLLPVTVREFFEAVGTPCSEKNFAAFKVLFGLSQSVESMF